ncbi:MAG: hypothetical protein A2161_12705 [Candidatus Schekmanbacteria bacterium RBG_13_48_7]|uniref:FAD/NAD(P)-binding domain-containing protein n=1 Tax=Candidatus Schekmanbacteria bacterium RBG_13_48_7 TaxID=1817878 RepID=A0A1F7S2V7_9BACT|nr:MAG: hypothetical protein A2161_12705 [Candidatus Schekmanbacteria bacterium RBG_13_48_7]
MKYVIVGAGIAGVTAAKTIRNIDKTGEIILIGKEQYFPYNRYVLTEYLCGLIEDPQLFYTSPDFFNELAITFRKGQYVKSIDCSKKTLKLFHNEVIPYDRLMLATGGCSSVGSVLRPYTKFIQRYCSLEDILLIKKQLPDIHRCIVSGEGLSTLDLMCGLRNLNKEIIYVTRTEKAGFPLIESTFGDQIHEFLVNKGIRIICEDRIVFIEKKDSRYQAVTFKGHELTGDMIFASDHYQPNIKCIKDTPIERKTGILVDLHLKTSLHDIYAAGDCVEIYHPGVKDYWINFGWPNALKQGEIAGKNMAGQIEEYKISDVIVFNLMGKSLTARWWE